MCLVRGGDRQRTHTGRRRGAAHIATRHRPPPAGTFLLAARGPLARRRARMNFEDEPVPGYPLPILPGHTSPGRLERVLRAGAFAVTAELAPPDSADPDEVYKRARVFD